MEHEHHIHHHEAPKGKVKVGRKLKIWLSIGVVFWLLTFSPHLNSLQDSFYNYLGLIWWAVLLGLFLGGVIEYFIPSNFVYKFLGRKGPLKILYATIAGFILSACSHGILAISMQLYKKGAAIPAVIALLLAAPWANIAVTILLFSFFGIKALLFIGGALLIALTTGLIFMGLEKKGLIEQSLVPNLDEKTDWSRLKHFDLKRSTEGVAAGIVNLANMVLWWIIIGFLVAVLIQAYVPESAFMDYFGPSFWGLMATLGVATIIEICSEGSAPVALEIFNKVGTLGNPFVFLMAGVVTDYTEIGLIWTNIGRKAALWLPIVAVPQVVLLGWVFNQL